MSRKILLVALTIALVAGLIGGGTMAWFTAKADAPVNEFTAGTVMIAAGTSTTMTNGFGENWVVVDVFPEEVVSSDQGTRPDGGAVRSQRSNPNAVLSLGTGQSESNFFSLGFKMDEISSTPGNPETDEYWSGSGGEIVVRFSEKISAYDDRLLLVVEDTWGGWPVEKAQVFVSKNGNDWTPVGFADNTMGNPQSHAYISVPDAVEWFQYVKVVDKSNPYDTPQNTSLNNWWTQWNNDAFDLNTIMVQRWERENWNPGDCDELEYYVRNTGTKNIHTRVELSGVWVFDWDWLWENWDALCYSERGERPDRDSTEWDEFVAYVEGLDDPVSFGPCDDNTVWVEGDDGLFYYTGELGPNEDTTFCLKVCFDGELAVNAFQGASYSVSARFDAVQSSNDAPFEVWGVTLY